MAQLRFLERLLSCALLVRVDLEVRRVDREETGGPVEDRRLVPAQLLRRCAETDNRREPERSRENGDVRRARAGVGRDRDDRVAVELHREARREVVRDEDRVGALRQIHRVVVRQVEQQRQHPDLDVLQIADTLAEHGMARAREALPPLEHHDLERLLGARDSA